MHALQQNNTKNNNNQLSSNYYILKNGKKRRIMMLFADSFSCSKRTFYNKINGITKIRKAELAFLTNLINE